VLATAFDDFWELIRRDEQIACLGPLSQNAYLSPKLTCVNRWPMFVSIMPHNSS
jgi:hypothetical protein